MMHSGNILQIIMIATGVFLLIVTTTSLARRRMTESFCLAWGLISVILVMAGIFLRPAEWSYYISTMGMVLVILIGFCIIYVAYFMSAKVSELSRKNQELAMQVSLLNQENERILERLEQLIDVDKRKL
ncbi:MAG: DUF2304 domain-containing protein [Acetatifactor sp.]|nr:DUF2304 domain-containing protein [Acetatifactor sp.]